MVRGTRPALASVVIVAIIAAGGAVLAASGHGADASAAATVSRTVTIARTVLPSTARDVHGDAGGELLSVDLRADGSAQVMLYDYSTGLTHQVTVRSGKVASDQSAPGMQPPATHDETAAAFAIALRTQPSLPFAVTFAQQQGVPLVSAAQVKVDAEPWTAADPHSACVTDRCLQLRVATAAGEYLDTRGFVVDLSTGTVLHVKSAR